MIREIDDFTSGKITLERQDVATARHLLDRLTELVGGGPSRRSGSIAKARHGLACQILASRRARAALFPNDIFDEPAWDILLQLYCAIGKNEVMTTQALGRSALSPCSTIERWVKHLVERDLVEYVNGTGRVDRQVNLSKNGITRLDAYFRMLLDHHFQV